MNRTTYRATITLSARERGAVKRWTADDYVPGDFRLTQGVLRRVMDKARKVRKDNP